LGHRSITRWGSDPVLDGFPWLDRPQL